MPFDHSLSIIITHPFHSHLQQVCVIQTCSLFQLTPISNAATLTHHRRSSYKLASVKPYGILIDSEKLYLLQSPPEPEFGLLGALPEDVWFKIFQYLEPPALSSVMLLNSHFSFLIRSYGFLERWGSIFPTKSRSIQMSWHDIAAVHKSTFRIPLNTGQRVSDYPKNSDDFDCAHFPHTAKTAGQFFSNSSSIRILANVFSRVRGYHRKIWCCRYFGDRLCRVWHIPWDEPHSSSEHRVFQYPEGMFSSPPFASWGDFLMWKESSREPLKTVHIKGLTMFAIDPSMRKRILRQFSRWLKLFKGKRESGWYDIVNPETEPDVENNLTPPFVALGTINRNLDQLRLFNLFTGKEYIIPFVLILDAIKFLDYDNPILYPHDVVENTMCSKFILFFSFHTPTQTAFMVWDVEYNRPKWKEVAVGAICEDEYRIKRLLFGNALMGYLAKSTHNSTIDKYEYIIRDLTKGNVIQTFQLDEYRDPLSSMEFHCAFTSFVFIVSEPGKFVDNFMHSDQDSNLTASFHIYSIATGQKIYVLDCPMNYPRSLDFSIIPWFQRTDESERYWFFLCPDILGDDDDIVNKVYIWDVVLQEWTLLASRCLQKETSTIVYMENGRMKMTKIDVHMPDPFEEEDKALSKYRWRRLPTVKEVTKLDFSQLVSVRRGLG